MSDQTPIEDDTQVVFDSLGDLAKYLDISLRRLHQYKESGGLNYATGAVLVDRKELDSVKLRIAQFAAKILTPYVPHRFRSRRGKRKSYRRTRDKSVGPGNPELCNRSPNRQGSQTSEAEYNELLNRGEERIEELMRKYGLDREEAIGVLKNDERR